MADGDQPERLGAVRADEPDADSSGDFGLRLAGLLARFRGVGKLAYGIPRRDRIAAASVSGGHDWGCRFDSTGCPSFTYFRVWGPLVRGGISRTAVKAQKIPRKALCEAGSRGGGQSGPYRQESAPNLFHSFRSELDDAGLG